jgi:alpha-mannosidase
MVRLFLERNIAAVNRNQRKTIVSIAKALANTPRRSPKMTDSDIVEAMTDAQTAEILKHWARWEKDGDENFFMHWAPDAMKSLLDDNAALRAEAERLRDDIEYLRQTSRWLVGELEIAQDLDQ